MWYPFACSICDKRVPDHWTPECRTCLGRHVLCRDHHVLLSEAGMIRGYGVEEWDDMGNAILTRQGTVETCPTPELMLALKLMERSA